MATRAKAPPDILPDWVRSDIEKRIRVCMLELPLLPSVAGEVLEFCSRGDSDATQIAKILHRDQALAGNVIRVANSPLFGATVEVSSLQQAVGRIGIRTIRDVVLSVATKAAMFEAPAAWNPCIRDLPRLSLVSALYAAQVARCCESDDNLAFLSGFLHDMGWPVVMLLLQKLEARHDKTLDLPVVQAACQRYHADVGAELARSWHIAEPAVVAIRHHETWSQMDPVPEGAPLVSLADQLARATMPEFPQGEESVLTHPAVGPLNLDLEKVRGLLEMGDHILEMADVVL